MFVIGEGKVMKNDLMLCTIYGCNGGKNYTTRQCMMIEEKDFEDVIELLNKNEVKYVVIGAYSVSFYGRPRNTGDINFFIGNSDDNIGNLLTSLEKFGFKSLNLTVDDFGDYKMLQLGY